MSGRRRQPAFDPHPGSLPEAVVQAYIERWKANLRAQGQPDHLSNPAVLDRLAGMVRAGHETSTGAKATTND